MIDPIRAETIKTLYRQLRASSAAAAIVTLYMMGVAIRFTSWRVILPWLAVQIATQVFRELLYRAWRRTSPEGIGLERWALAYTGYMAVAGLVWGSTIFLFAHLDQPITVAMTLCGLYGISSGSVPGNAYNPPGLYAFIGLIFTAIMVRLIGSGDFEYGVLGAASGGFAAIMTAFCRVQANTIEEGFRIRFENRDLIEALGHQTSEAEEARRRADAANLAKSHFLAAASHDLRQPLYALSLFSASLNELRLDPAAQKVVDDICRSVAALEKLFDGLLDVSRLEVGVVQPRLEPVDVDQLFDRLSQYHRMTSVERGIDLRFRSNGEWVTSDSTLLEQTLSNLLGNALRYSEKGAVLVAARRRKNELRFEVWDTGIGIAEEDRIRIFDEFVQVSNPERDRRNGLGLGLAIARRAAVLIGAKIDLASVLGRGSRFAFSQPLTTAPSETTPEVVLPMIAVASRRPILIVEDEPQVRAALVQLLNAWEIPADLVAHGEAALDLIMRRSPYALLLADYRLPGGFNGISLIDAAREICPDLPTILITADFDAALVTAAAERDIPVVCKPVPAATLHKMLSDTLSAQA